MAKSKTTRDDLNSHEQLTLEESKKRIDKVLSKLDNLEEDEGGEPNK